MGDSAVEEEVDDIQEVRGLNPCKGGEITYFSGELLILHIFPIFFLDTGAIR